MSTQIEYYRDGPAQRYISMCAALQGVPDKPAEGVILPALLLLNHELHELNSTLAHIADALERK